VTTLTDLRSAVAAALAAIAEVDSGDWAVIDAPTDAVEPPAFVLQWGPDPWREPLDVCHDAAQLEIVAVAARLTPEANYPILEQMVDAAHTALAAGRLRPARTLRPGPLEVAQITYLAARIQIRRPVDTGGT
jgi:hypothetical protein